MPLIDSSTLPGSGLSRQFEGENHDVGISFFLVDAPPKGGPKLHLHHYEEVFIVHEGNGTFTLDDAQVDAGPGDILVATAQTPHKFVASGGDRLRLTAIHRSPRFVTEWLE